MTADGVPCPARIGCAHQLTTCVTRRSRTPGLAIVTWIAIAVLLLMPVGGIAQDVTEAALKAAYIYNFAKFTEWPGDVPAAQPLVMCVLGDAAVGEALDRAVAGRVVAGRRIVSSRVAAAAPKQHCQVLYISGVTATQAGALVADVRDVPVLTISDVEGFTRVGGVAQLFFENGQLRFRIARESAKRARLQISSMLLTMARPND
jgi:hypothetical protein